MAFQYRYFDYKYCTAVVVSTAGTCVTLITREPSVERIQITVGGSVTDVPGSLYLLGVKLDSTRSFDHHVNNVVKNWNYHLQALRHIRADYVIANMMACSIIGSCCSLTTPALGDVRNLLMTTPVFLPPNTTSVLQPCDQALSMHLSSRTGKQVVGYVLHAIYGTKEICWRRCQDCYRFHARCLECCQLVNDRELLSQSALHSVTCRPGRWIWRRRHWRHPVGRRVEYDCRWYFNICVVCSSWWRSHC